MSRPLFFPAVSYKTKIRSRVGSTVMVGSATMAFAFLGLTGQAKAQFGQTVTQGKKIIGDVKKMQQAADDAPLPDADSVEKGGNPPASVSFQPLNRKRSGSSDTSSDGNGNAAAGDGSGQGGPSSQPGYNPADRPISFKRVDPHSHQGGSGTQDQALDDFSDGEQIAPAEVPELHTVAKGDTLWTLCKQYYNDAYQWPRLWSLNPLVTNPHWIFPGDIVRLRAASGEPEPDVAPVADAAPAPESGGPRMSTSRGGLPSAAALVLRETGFVESADLRAAGRIEGSREEKILLSTGDQAYVSFRKDQPLKAGDRYTIFGVDTDSPIKDPKSEKVIGYLVRIYGDILIEQIADEDTGRGTLMDMIDPVERGFYVSNQIKQFKRVESKPSQVSLQASVIASFSATKLLAPSDYVVLSRGSKDGLEVGNRSYVIRRGDGYARLMEGWEIFDGKYPKEVVAELLVVDVADTTAVAWIARATKEIRVGETTEMRKGY